MLLGQLTQLKTQRVDAGTEVGKAIVSEGVALIARDLFESTQVGKLGKKLTRSFLDQKQKEQVLNQEGSIEGQQFFIIESLKTFLSSISVKRKSLKESNSSELLEKLDRSQEFGKVETRIKRTIITLKSIANKPLIYNKDIATQRFEKEVIVPSGKPFTGSIKLKEILKDSQGYVKIIDPYVDETTLELLLDVPNDLSIKLLTAQIGGDGKERRFRRKCQMFKEERPKFEIRKCDPKLFHDRFILTQIQGWNIGTSLKDVGKKMSMIKEMTVQTKHEVEKMFDQTWVKSFDLMSM